MILSVLCRCKEKNLKIENSPIYIIIDCSIKYQFESVNKAFDTIFKLFHTSHLCYPIQAEHLYLLIQRSIYKIQTEFDKSIPYI